ncbi:gamma-glutamyltranspeptidase [Acetobacter pasteurianus]|uniref:Gamma-glutamyltranspeptidase n=2 Tax=Acetobacter pasteurianus TaxID=438 RepID=C7JAS4_ACEP3|nr:gamma-glutamyltransferase [Acetobacter pasteurianus]BAU37121.1 gamma-glutamyltranspeptidase [Acetobacter pasteurianus NBRC 101655]ASC05555.1 Gamma-glutamyltransferase [Acetobacter pasteurianus subsp. pasteurianus]QHM91442.1 gamma-glutamyltransferase [Acetobacter pasteurianus]CCT59606.1 gamma-glutamyltranspeptidase [Acetobacter pasteurianus 386B]BAH98200.1 gamma-glutamyltranspeptidase [Acetobacter pasteurianus IFO 3283-01]
MAARSIIPRFTRFKTVLSGSRKRAGALALALTSVLPACSSGSHIAQPVETGFVGEVVADEPQAVLVGRDVLAKGGNAADAAAALGLALSVTLPSRASLGGGGACLAWKPGDSAGQAFVFLPRAGLNDAGADRPASVPMLARGLYLMQLRYGSVDFADLLLPARNLASRGVPVGGLLASDLAAVQAPLLADEKTRAIFGNANGNVLVADDVMVQTRLAGALERMRIAGVGDLYAGALGQTFADAARVAGAGLTTLDLRAAVPVAAQPLTARVDGVDISFLPPPADGGFGMAAAYLSNVGQNGGRVRAETAVSGWRARQGAKGAATSIADAQALLNSGHIPAGSVLPALPASTSFVVTDRQGESVGCAFTMNNLFGTGRIAGSTGIMLGASPVRKPLPLLPVAIAHRGNNQFQAAATASGQNVAADTAAVALQAAIAGSRPQVTNGVGRANFVSCPAGLPGDGSKCFGWTDPRGFGLALSSDHGKKS